MINLYEDLSWLPKPPDDFSFRLSKASCGNDLQKLAKFSLDDNQLNSLYNKIKLFKNDLDSLSPLIPTKIGLISNSTSRFISPAMIASALRFGILLEVIEAEYNQVAQEAFSENSIFKGHKLHAVLIALDHHGLPLLPTPGNKALAEKNVNDCLIYINSIIDSFHSKTKAPIIFQNIAPNAEKISGSYENRLPGTLSWLIKHVNLGIDDLSSNNTFIFDIAGLSANVGFLNWHDPRLWNMAKLPFSEKYIPLYADHLCRILAANLGKSRRCLILDLDNTLWGGVIGDDGIEGILIGNGNAVGEAYLHLQKTILELRERGIVLAVSSKNEDSAARQPFKEHPDMLIREKHIAVFQANWADKASNIKVISQALSLGLESIVFLDDNPAERMQVRNELPEVAVPELPQEPALYARTLLAAGYFESTIFLSEDFKRADFYQDNAKRVKILNQSNNMDDYLMSLNMEMTLTEFDAAGRSRISQLINKSNQFNLTTKRYSETDVEFFELDKLFFTRQIRLKDVFGDNGMISVIICKKQAETWIIDTWLMSCRVLGRNVELAALNDIIDNAKKAGVKKLVGKYIPTKRNVIVKNHYKKLGFTETFVENKTETWSLEVNNYNSPEVPIIINNVNN
jgi:FkbH-like protein